VLKQLFRGISKQTRFFRGLLSFCIFHSIAEPKGLLTSHYDYNLITSPAPDSLLTTLTTATLLLANDDLRLT
jgi:hypothetical protein